MSGRSRENLAVATATAMVSVAVASAVTIMARRRKWQEMEGSAGPGRGAPGKKRAKKINRNPMESTYANLMNSEGADDERTRNGQRFRKTFRVPYSIFQQIVAIARMMPYWNRMKDKDAVGRSRGPVEMYVHTRHSSHTCLCATRALESSHALAPFFSFTSPPTTNYQH
jgi:hypothetical protein